MLDAGLRCAEACALRWTDVDAPLAMIHVTRGKGARDRVIPVTWPVMRGLLDDRGPTDYVLWSLRGGHRPIVPRTLHKAIQRIGLLIGYHLHPHMLRHTYATELLRAGLSIRDVQVLLGHARLGTTEIYTHVEPADLAERLRRLTATPAQLTLIA